MFVRREFLNAVVAAIALPAMSRICNAATSQEGPQLTQLLKADLDGQAQTVQETVVNLLEMAPGVSAPWHLHPGAQEVIFVLDGNLVVEIDGKEPKEITAGGIALISAETPHLVRNERQARASALVTHSRADKNKPFLVVMKKPA
jgi:quercetin dioxygenase-like cupin family protein